MTPRLLDQAVKLTNEGTRLLVLGREDRAINEFKTALETMREIGLSGRHPKLAAAQPQDWQRAYSSFGAQASSLLADISEEQPQYASLVRLSSPPAATGGDHSFFFVYSQALKVNISVGMDHGADMDTLISAIIIFNMALLYHLKGTREQNAASKHHAKSMRLYALSLELLKNQKNSSSYHEDVVLLQVACWNNMSHISYEQADVDRALLQLCEVQWLLRMMDDRPSHFTEEDMGRFMLNGMFMHALSTARAA
jgi:tetratricopeptide (TPR) repeat protein